MGYKYSKENILNIGYDVLRKNGYHSVGINQILKECGIPKGSFYNFFKSKEDFVQQVINQYGTNNQSWIERFFEDTPLSPLNALEAFYRMMMNMNEQDEYAGGCLVNNMSMEVGRNIDSIAEESDKHFSNWLGVFSMVIEKGQKQNEIIQTHSPNELAEYIHAGFYGALSRSKVTKSRIYLDKWLQLTIEFISV